MSLKAKAIPKVPEQTLRVARAAFPKVSLYLKMRDELGTFMRMPILPICFRLADNLPFLRGRAKKNRVDFEPDF